MYRFIILVSLLSIISCSGGELVQSDSILVVEGYIENDGYPVVMLTKTLPISSSDNDINNLSDYLLKWAKVSVVHGEDTVVLTGKYDSGYFPPYVYTTSRLKGSAGESYELIVEYKNMNARAITTIPQPPVVNGYKIEKCADNDTLYQIKALMTADVNNKKYYQFFTKVGADNSQFLASFLGSIADSVAVGEYEVSVYRGHQMTDENYTPYFAEGDSVAVKCCSLNDYEYVFWKRYVESEYLSSAAMLSVSNNLPTNITGGIGYWFGYGATTSYFIINP